MLEACKLQDHSSLSDNSVYETLYLDNDIKCYVCSEKLSLDEVIMHKYTGIIEPKDMACQSCWMRIAYMQTYSEYQVKINMRKASDIYDETHKELSEDNCQSLTNIAIAAIDKTQKEMFYLLYDKALENPTLTLSEFFDKMDSELIFVYEK